MNVWRTAILLGILASGAAGADFSAMSSDGWYSWRVDAVTDAPDWCCFGWNTGKPYRTGCNLDNHQSGYGSSDESRFGARRFFADEIQVYARLQDGEVAKVLALSSRCPVSSETEIVDLGRMANEDSIRRLLPETGVQTDASSHALAAISVHAGPAALRALLDVAEKDQHLQNRKDAIFWLGQLRAREAEDEMVRLMVMDPEAEFREHAAFSLSQSVAPGRVAALARLGREDADNEVRAQAWFWLAQADAEAVDSEIYDAIVREPDEHVRHQAIFALAQLPEGRAVKTLALVIENRGLAEDDRKQALFWMAQLDSDPAMAYIDRLLSDN